MRNLILGKFALEHPYYSTLPMCEPHAKTHVRRFGMQLKGKTILMNNSKSMEKELTIVTIGLALVLLKLLFGLRMGIVIGVNEDVFKDYIGQGVTANPDVHDSKSADKIWHYA
ncbi:hypothetical protein ACTRXD_05390 [Nitrospira sp. T9]|uniref:hypothetical protein n=1 Tax=unclassified Nitrospira TaxID=2652172 RepID=UPI003F943FA4